MKIFIVCPANIATGGTELLHQFGQKVLNHGIDCYMVYVNARNAIYPTPDSFLKYNVPYVSKYADSTDSILVLPETAIHLIDWCKEGIAICWWLSVNNYIQSYQKYILSQNQYDIFSLKKRTNILHFVQSFYAKDFLKNVLDISESYFLMDYINEDIVEIARQYSNTFPRENICLYNPLKGFDNLSPIIDACDANIQWIPLKGLSPNELALLMCKAKVYIDFGSHPGKDRIPREAAICGCCVITNQEGSAAYESDVPIPPRYKLKDMTNIVQALHMIYECMDHYQQCQLDFCSYVQTILSEADGFEQDLNTALNLLQSLIDSQQTSVSTLPDKYQDVFSHFHQTLAKMDDLLYRAENAYNNGNTSEAIAQLLNTDYVTNISKETLWALLEDIK